MDIDYFKEEWREFKAFEKEEHGRILGKLVEVEKKVDDLNKWRWTMTGINITISFAVATFGVYILSGIFK